VLEIQFEGESGFGTGVTQNFYSCVANELQRAAADTTAVGADGAKRPPVWLGAAGGDGGATALAGAGATGGLFPRPVRDAGAPEALRDDFFALGQLMAKACLDRFCVPLPLSAAFLALVRGDPVGTWGLPPPGATGGVVSAYAALCRDAAGGPRATMAAQDALAAPAPGTEFAARYLHLSYEMSVADFLDALGEPTFVCPVTGVALCAGGDKRPLTVAELPEFVRLVMQFWFRDGVSAQVHAFRDGLQSVFPIEPLLAFDAVELRALLCGRLEIEWEESELQRHILPSGGLTRDAPAYRLLIEELLAMPHAERAHFLNFVTACPHLPPAGLEMLEIEVAPQRAGLNTPTSQTCGNKLYLPAYRTIEELRQGLHVAFANAEYGGLHENTN